jgi:hypothetical protein
VLRSVKRVRVSRERRNKRRITLARRPFGVPAGGTGRLKLQLSRTNLGILKLNRRIRTRVAVTLTNAAGLTSTASKTITLHAPRSR